MTTKHLTTAESTGGPGGVRAQRRLPAAVRRAVAGVERGSNGSTPAVTPTRSGILARAGIAPVSGMPSLGLPSRPGPDGALMVDVGVGVGGGAGGFPAFSPSSTYGRTSGGWGGGLYITDAGGSNILPSPPMDGLFGTGGAVWGGVGAWGGWGAADAAAHSMERIRAYSRWLERNCSVVRAAIQRLDTLAMRDGPTLQSATGDKAFDARLEAAWKAYTSSPRMGGFRGACCDLTRRWTHDQMRSVVFRSAFVDGDMLVHLCADEDNRPAVQLIPGDHVGSDGSGWGGGGGGSGRGARNKRGSKPESTPRRDGLDLDPVTGRVRGYAVRTLDQDGRQTTTTIKAEDAVLMRWPLHERAEHLRGEPALAAAVEPLFTLDLSDAAVHQAVINAAAYGIYITTEHPEDGPPAGVMDSVDGGGAGGLGGVGGAESIGMDHGSGLGQTPVTPGAVMHLKVGEGVQTTQATQPTGNYAAFSRALQMTLSSDMGIAGDLVTLNAEHGNYSAQRTNVSLSWMTSLRLQAWIEDDFDWTVLQHFTRWWITLDDFEPPAPPTTPTPTATDLDDGEDDGQDEAEITPPSPPPPPVTEPDALLAWILARCSFAQPLQPSLDPAKEVQGYGQAINQRLMDFDEACLRLTGRTFEQTATRLAAQIKRLRELGIEPVGLPGQVMAGAGAGERAGATEAGGGAEDDE